MSGYLTTHVLDTARGVPAAGLRIDLFRIEGSDRTHLFSATTNADGRTDQQILPEGDFMQGEYELLFHTGPYLVSCGHDADALFLSLIPIRFQMAEPTHYHVPLLLSPYGYSTYRGS